MPAEQPSAANQFQRLSEHRRIVSPNDDWYGDTRDHEYKPALWVFRPSLTLATKSEFVGAEICTEFVPFVRGGFSTGIASRWVA
jgi:hypothetical protein